MFGDDYDGMVVCIVVAGARCWYQLFLSRSQSWGIFFVGIGSNKSYVNDYVIWSDTFTWSHGMVENLVEDIGYEMHGRIKVY
jgi:hypothetical protein